MTFRKSIFLLISLGMVAALVGCSSSSSPKTTTITVSLSTVTSPLTVNSQTQITATTNDTAGVTWSCTPAGTCGTFAPTSTLSGAATTYTAPAAASNVVITATSVTNTAISASTSAITIAAASATLADGTYAFSLSGLDNADFSLYDVAGVITVAGGAITGGEQDFVDFDNYSNGGLGGVDLINPTGSTITASADGNLQIVLTTCNGTDCTTTDTSLGVSGVETLNASLFPLNTNNAAITEFDGSSTASGELDLQDTTAAAATPSGGYVFSLSGFDTNEIILSIGGVINIDGAGTISGAGSIFDANDGSSGSTFQAETFTSGTVSAPDSMGRVTITLNPTDTVDFPQIILAGYIVKANKIFLVETADNYFGTTGGTALGQGANTGTFTATSVSGLTYVAGLNGFDGAGAANAAGLFTLNADTTISGFVNYNDLSGVGVQAPSPITGGTWVEDVGTGRVSLIGVTDGNATFYAEVYLDAPTGSRLLTITLDTTDDLAGRGFEQSGVGAFTAGSFSGAYAVGATGWDVNELEEFDAVGTANADGVGTIPTGFTDINAFFTPTPDVTLSGTFTAAASGVFTGTITGLDVTTGANADAFSYYMVDSTGDNIMIETDPNQVTLGYFAQQ